MHISNLVHAGYLLLAWGLIIFYVRRTQANRFRTTLRLLQIIPAVFALDFILGVTLIEHMFDSHASAGWISKSALLYPMMFLAAICFMYHLRRRQKQARKLQ